MTTLKKLEQACFETRYYLSKGQRRYPTITNTIKERKVYCLTDEITFPLTVVSQPPTNKSIPFKILLLKEGINELTFDTVSDYKVYIQKYAQMSRRYSTRKSRYRFIRIDDLTPDVVSYNNGTTKVSWVLNLNSIKQRRD